MTKEKSPENRGSGKQQQQVKQDKKKESEKKKRETSDLSRDNISTESDPETSRMEDQNEGAQIPAKLEMSGMLLKLENSIKGEITALQTDLGMLLTRVEGMEEQTDKQAQELNKLKEQVRTTQINQRKILYKLEDQENQSRRQNLRIQALPEKNGEDLRKTIQSIFNLLLDKGVDDRLKFNRIHRVRKPKNIAVNHPRDILVRFQKYEEKAEIWGKMRGRSPIKYEGVELQIFAGTLARRRHIKPSSYHPHFHWGGEKKKNKKYEISNKGNKYIRTST